MADRKYECHKCHVNGVKLWRDYGMPFHWDLWCVDCACAATGNAKSSAKIDPASVRDDGSRVSSVRFVLANEFGGPIMVRFDCDVPEASYLGKHGDMQVDRREEVSDSLGWRVPAVPSDGPKDAPDAYWGYTSTESEDYAWWVAQPLRAKAPVDA